MSRLTQQAGMAAGYDRLQPVPLRHMRPAPLGGSRDRLLPANHSTESVPESDVTDNGSASPSTVTTPGTEPEPESEVEPVADSGFNTRAQHGGRPSRPSMIETRLTPILVPEGYASLNWRPKTLQAGTLITMTIVSFSIACATVSVWQVAGSDLQISLTNESVHFISTYLPAIVATITGLIYLSTMMDFCRTMPYYAMADSKKAITKGSLARDSVGGSFYPWPGVLLFRIGWLVMVFNLLSISLQVTMFLTAAKVILFTSKRIPYGWTLIVNPTAAKYITAAYIIHGSMYLMVLVWVSGHQTGLKWDPATQQDLLTLFAQTRATVCFECLSACKDAAFELMPSDFKWRIGYWKKIYKDATGQEIESVVYGICPLNPSGEVTVIYEPILPTASPRAVLQTPCGCRSYPTCRHGPRRFCVRSRWQALFGQAFHLAFYLAGITACMFAFGTQVFTNGFRIRDTWKDPDVHFNWWIIGGQAMTDTNLPYAMVFRFVPTQVAFWTVGLIRFLDTSVRASQIWRSMSSEAAFGSDSIALEYQTMLAFQIPLVALEKRHFRVMWFTAVNAVSSLCPIFVSGLFIIEKQDGYVYFTIAKVSFFAVLFFCVIFTISIVWAWTREFDRLPRLMYSIADQMTLCRGARILDEKCLDIADPRVTREKFQAKMVLLENKYQLGFYAGTCGHDHFGYDVVETSADRQDAQGTACNLVTPVTRQPRSGVNAAGLYQRLRARRQEHVGAEDGEDQV